MCFAPQRRALFRHLNFQKWSDTGVFCTFWLRNVLRATTACTFSTSQLPKVVQRWCVLYILTWKCASRHNGVHFFRHLNFQKWSDAGVFCAFWLGNVLRATTACTFFDISTSKVVQRWCVLYILTSKCASRHNGVHFFISHLASWLRTRRFSEPTFRPSGAPNHWKNTVFRDFPTFSHICIFFLLTLSLLIFFLLIFLFSLPLPCSAFHLSILSEVWLLNFLRLLLLSLLLWLFIMIIIIIIIIIISILIIIIVIIIIAIFLLLLPLYYHYYYHYYYYVLANEQRNWTLAWTRMVQACPNFVAK